MPKAQTNSAMQNAQEFVRTVITEIYQQKAPANLVKSTAKRVVEALPVNQQQPTPKNPAR